MNNTKKLAASGLALAVVGSFALDAVAQSKNPLAGTWMLVSQETMRADGTKSQGYGPDPKGLLVFTENGYYSLQVCRNGRAKFASGNREKGTPEEYQATVHGCNPHWGRYAVSGDVIAFNIEDAMYPNWSGLKQDRKYRIDGDRLHYFVPAGSTGGTAELVWRRMK